ncbi:hypothetical protein HanRHA438_Chr09g0414811 [Helianthus annuus]|nr:hypothetical protein HanRHA438_Chr09g0414811 [Helianthus annuus]
MMFYADGCWCGIEIGLLPLFKGNILLFYSLPWLGLDLAYLQTKPARSSSFTSDPTKDKTVLHKAIAMVVAYVIKARLISRGSQRESLDQLKAISDPIFFSSQQGHKHHKLLNSIFGELQEVLREADDLKRWLDDKEAEQQKLSASSTSAYTSQKVIDKLLDLKDKWYA